MDSNGIRSTLVRLGAKVALAITIALILSLPLARHPEPTESAPMSYSVSVTLSYNMVGSAPPSAPTGFLILDMGSSSINATWNSVIGATSYTIVVRRDRYPTSITDGEVIYSGNGTEATDSGYNLEGTTYYAAVFANNAFGSSTPATSSVGGTYMQLLATVLLCLVPVILIGLAYTFRKMALAFIAGGAWWVISALAFSQSQSAMDSYFILGFLAAGAGIAFALLGASIREPYTAVEEPASPYVQKFRDYKDKQEAIRQSTIPRSPLSTVRGRIGKARRRSLNIERRRRQE